MVVVKDRGSAILVQVEFKKNDPYGDMAYFDPTNPTPVISIIDPQGNLKVTDAALTKKDALEGRYFYICQTAENWPGGLYRAKAKGGDGTYSDITVNAEIFRLK